MHHTLPQMHSAFTGHSGSEVNLGLTTTHLPLYRLLTKTLNPKPLNPKPLNPKPRNPKPPAGCCSLKIWGFSLLLSRDFPPGEKAANDIDQGLTATRSGDGAPRCIIFCSSTVLYHNHNLILCGCAVYYDILASINGIVKLSTTILDWYVLNVFWYTRSPPVALRR